MSTRDAVFAKIRRSLGVTGEEPRRNATVDDRLKRAPAGVIPARGQGSSAEQVALFVKMAEKASATVARVADVEAIPAAVADYLRSQNLPARLRLGEDPLLNGLNWTRTHVEMKHGASDGTDAIGLSHALAGVAETGTLILTSGSDNPTTINFLPDTHVVVLKAADIVGDYEAAWTAIRTIYGKGALPRTVNMVTGPSRSADIEQTLLLGVHGPRRLHIVVVG
jgi:L-lactate dehydrogenase complex protein LldG